MPEKCADSFTAPGEDYLFKIWEKYYVSDEINIMIRTRRRAKTWYRSFCSVRSGTHI